jgi:hypothetical protein
MPTEDESVLLRYNAATLGNQFVTLQGTQCLHLEGSRTLRRSIETCRSFLKIQLSTKYIVHLLVICCKYMQNAWYAQFQDYEHAFTSTCISNTLHSKNLTFSEK